MRKKLQSHLGEEHYSAARELDDGPSSLGRRLLDHLAEVCNDCRRFWQQLGNLRPVLLDRLDQSQVAAGAEPDDPWEMSVTEYDLEEQTERVAEMRRRRRRAWEQKSRLLNTPAEKRAQKIQNARSQFQSKLLAEEFLAAGRKAMAEDPQRAVERFRLMRHVVSRANFHHGPEWAWSLLLQARAWEANALRIAGELRIAGKMFSDLSADLAERPTGDVECRALLASLEAALCLEDERFDEATALLAKAATLYRAAGSHRGEAKAEMRQAILYSKQGNSEAALARYEGAAEKIRPGEDDDLVLPIVTGRIKVLSDLDRAIEARHLLEAHLDHFEADPRAQAGAYYRVLEGRIASCLDDYTTAQESFEAAIDAFLTLDRTYDATLAALDLAQVYLLAGKLHDLYQLVPPLIVRLSAHGVPAKVAQVLALLEKGVARQQVSLALLSELRSMLEAGHRSI